MKLTINQRRLFAVLEQLAADDAACPTNSNLGERIGCSTEDAAKIMGELRRAGAIEIDTVHIRRQVTIVATGAKTAVVQPKLSARAGKKLPDA